MYIVHQGKALNMNATIESSNIRENETVTIAVKGKGGSEGAIPDIGGPPGG